MENKTLSELLKKGDIRQFTAEKSEISALLGLAERDLKRAEKDLADNDFDWSLAVSYNSILQAARAWMLFKGYRPALGEGHAVIIQFATATLESFGERLLLDGLRRKRHIAIYEHTGSVSKYEAEHSLKTAKHFLEFVKKKIGD